MLYALELPYVVCFRVPLCFLLYSYLMICVLELPYGWEKVVDEHYGTYYIE